MKKSCLVFALFGSMAMSHAVFAEDSHASHGHDSHGSSQEQHQSGMDNMGDMDDMGSQDDMSNMSHGGGMFLVEKEIDGYTVSFHVMAAAKGMEHGGSHNFMVKIEKGGKVVDDVKINSKVILPNGDAESKPLMKMGDWYMNGYDLGHHGQHQLMVLFKTTDGAKHKAGVHYPQ